MLASRGSANATFAARSRRKSALSPPSGPRREWKAASGFPQDHVAPARAAPDPDRRHYTCHRLQAAFLTSAKRLLTLTEKDFYAGNGGNPGKEAHRVPLEQLGEPVASRPWRSWRGHPRGDRGHSPLCAARRRKRGA